MDNPGIFDVFRQAIGTHLPVAADVYALPRQTIYSDCSGAARTVYLPASAVHGDWVAVFDAKGNSATNNITVDRNGNTINGASSNFVIDVDYGMVILWWNAGDWLLDLGGVDIIGGAGRTLDITFIMDGQGSAITTGAKGWIRIPWACTLTGWKMTADQSTTSTIDVWKDTYANWPPDNTDTITNAHEPAISGATKAEDTDISDWITVAVAAGDFIRVNVDANDNATYLELSLTAERT